ncbi:hypothetical protein GO491_09700 [Flavobacteriaceae bacterium Ap0902]|nr:hypothetical protein [Flavobacteriaceae bacterium Ap0902]
MKQKLHLILLLGIFSILNNSCKDSQDISSGQAMSMVTDYVAENPIFETGKFQINKFKLNSTKDQDLIVKLQELESEGYIEIIDEKKRRKWFSKDSVFIITPTLTDKSYPYIVKQNRNNVEVKTLIYEIDLKQEVNFEKKTSKQATFNVLLLKEKTPFYQFGKDSNPNSDFITRKFKARYTPERGWQLVK